MPPWMWAQLVLLAAATALLWGVNRRRLIAERRFTARQCLGCGYDLTHSPATCPECGRPTPPRLDPAKLRRPPPFGRAVAPDDVTAVALDHVVHQTPDQTEARLLVLQLGVRGIPARRTDAAYPGQRLLVLFQVSVRPADAGRAAAVVDTLT